MWPRHFLQQMQNWSMKRYAKLGYAAPLRFRVILEKPQGGGKMTPHQGEGYVNVVSQWPDLPSQSKFLYKALHLRQHDTTHLLPVMISQRTLRMWTLKEAVDRRRPAHQAVQVVHHRVHLPQQNRLQRVLPQAQVPQVVQRKATVRRPRLALVQHKTWRQKWRHRRANDAVIVNSASLSWWVVEMVREKAKCY